ncbi:MAG: glycosyltransferase family 9 protein [Omnitrophica bacterium]|nr:glycosyltransferase family 9 protein [Candidatus Omnitrophota bacterium]
MKIDKSRVKRILVITLSNLGDVVLTTPVLGALLGEFPLASLDVMVGPRGREIFEGHERISDVIIYDKKSSWPEKFTLLLALRKKKYDMVIDLKNTVFPLLLGAKFITNPVRHIKKNVTHKRDVHLSRLREMGIDPAGCEFHIPVKDSDKKHAEELLSEVKEKPFVVISPGAKSHVKRWPLKNFARLADMIKKEFDYEVVLIGDENDRIVIERILSNMKTVPLNLIEKTNIPELLHIIKKSSLVITNDSAPLHIAGTLGARILVFFGPTDEREYGPRTRAKSKVLKKALKCSPCTVPQCINSENKYECLKTISTEEAYRAVRELLEVKNANTSNENR